MPTEIYALIALAIVTVAVLWDRRREALSAAVAQERADRARGERETQREARAAQRRVEERHRFAREQAPALHRRVTASLVGNEGGIEGVITEYLPDDLRFEDVRFLAAGKPPETVTGSVLIPRDRILLMQVHQA